MFLFSSAFWTVSQPPSEAFGLFTCTVFTQRMYSLPTRGSVCDVGTSFFYQGGWVVVEHGVVACLCTVRKDLNHLAPTPRTRASPISEVFALHAMTRVFLATSHFLHHGGGVKMVLERILLGAISFIPLCCWMSAVHGIFSWSWVRGAHTLRAISRL